MRSVRGLIARRRGLSRVNTSTGWCCCTDAQALDDKLVQTNQEIYRGLRMRRGLKKKNLLRKGKAS